MRAILINPWNQTVEEVDLPIEHITVEESLKEIYAKLSVPERKVDDFNCLRIGETEILHVDGEGFLTEGIPVWHWMNYLRPLCGNGLITGINPVGDTAASELKLEPVRRQVIWSSQVSAGYLTGAGMTGPNQYTLGEPVIKGKDQP